jgi:hypothetical protein
MDPGGWDEIDEMIVGRRILAAIRAIRDLSDCSLSRAIELLSDRYEVLRKGRPKDFAVGPDEYWQGFDS